MLNLLNASAVKSNILEIFLETVLPYIIVILEIMGIFVVIRSAVHSFWKYIQNSFFKKEHNIQFDFATGLATGLEFKMAAEILKTVLVRNINELLVLGAVILLRAILSVLIHFEMKHNKHENTKDCD